MKAQIASVASMFVCTSVLAQGSTPPVISVLPNGYPAGCWDILENAWDSINGGWKIKLRSNNCPTCGCNSQVKFTITSISSEPIHYIFVEAYDPGFGVVLNVGGPSSGFALPSVGSIWANTSSTSWVRLEDLRTSGDVGSVEVHQISLIRCQGDITGLIKARKLDSDYGAISLVNVDGDFLGTMNAETEIDQLLVDGDIGTSTSPVLIQAPKQIAFVQANRMWANIKVCSFDSMQPCPPTSEGWLGRVETTGGASGHFDGSIAARLLTQVMVSTPFAGFDIDGDFNGTLDLSTGGVLRPITIADDMTGTMILGTIAAAGTLDGYVQIGGNLSGDIVAERLDDSDSFIEILGSLTTEGSIIFNDSTPIVGQVIINSANTSDEWDGTIKVNGSSGTTLSPKPLYTNTSLGGGAVGEVPYSCHFGECNPPGTHYGSSGVASTTPTGGTDSVTLWHYGPVEWSGFPYVVS